MRHMNYDQLDNADAPSSFLHCLEFLVNLSASADVLAMAKVEVDLNAIPEGKNVSGSPPPLLCSEGPSYRSACSVLWHR